MWNTTNGTYLARRESSWFKPGPSKGWIECDELVFVQVCSQPSPVHIWDSLWHAPFPTRKNDLYFVSGFAQKIERVRFEPITNTTLLVSPATFSCHFALATFLKVHFSLRTGLSKAAKIIKYHFFWTTWCNSACSSVYLMKGEADYCGFRWTESGQHHNKIVDLTVFKTNVFTYTALFKKWDCSFHQGVRIILKSILLSYNLRTQLRSQWKIHWNIITPPSNKTQIKTNYANRCSATFHAV